MPTTASGAEYMCRYLWNELIINLENTFQKCSLVVILTKMSEFSLLMFRILSANIRGIEVNLIAMNILKLL